MPLREGGKGLLSPAMSNDISKLRPMERLLAIAPDLVVATGRERTDAAAVLQRAGIPVLWLKTDTIELILDALVEIGRHVGKQEEAQQLAVAMRSELESIAQQHRHIPYEFSVNPLPTEQF